MQYNQPTSGQQVRIGNWFEELKLKEETGIRYFPPQQDKSKSLMTKARCITHTERVDSKDYKTTIQESMIPPQIHPEYKWSQQSTGPRQKRLQDQLNAKIEAEIKEKELQERIEANRFDVTTETKEKFSRSGFVSSSSLSFSSTSNRVLKNHLGSDEPITIYSDSLKRNEPFKFPSTFIASTEKPFAKNTFFSTYRGESFERPRQLPSPIDYQNLVSFRRRLLNKLKESYPSRSSSSGQAIRTLLGSLWNEYKENDREENGGGMIPLAVMESMLKERYDIVLLPKEINSILTAYAIVDSEDISLPEFCRFLRVPLTGRRLALVNTISSLICDKVDDTIDVNDIKVYYKGSDIDEFIDQLRFIHQIIENENNSYVMITTITKADLFDYYTDISSEIENDRDFESLIVKSWGISE